MIGKTLSLNTANIRTSSKTNKQKQYFFDTKQTFFNCEKSLHANTLNTLQARTESATFIPAFFLKPHNPTTKREREDHFNK